ncbi:MAG: VWA domain-containing protein, partial [Magnetococcales bacterium]|nr:VWA domain-containing protein [Magnetococcales bacterium]
YLNRTIALILCLVLSLGMLLSAARGDDTEIFFGRDWTEGGTVRPNILFVLDTSGSMSSYDGTSSSRLERMKLALRQLLSNVSGVNVGLMRFSDPGGSLLFPISHIDAEVAEIEGGADLAEASSAQATILEGNDDAEESATGTMTLDDPHLEMVTLPASTTTLSRQISSDHDAVEQRPDGSMRMDSSDLELVEDSGTQIVGLRFPDLNIPQGATILDARVAFEIDRYRDQDTNLSIQGQAVDNAPPFTNTWNGVSSRTKTTASTDWNDLPILHENEMLTTPNMNGIIQEIVNRPGWNSGNAIALISSGEGKREVESVSPEGGSAAPKLIITYDSSGGLTSDQRVGLRFRELMVPQGATISSATLTFHAAAAESTPLSLAIHGDDSDHSLPFTETTGNLSSRTLTSAVTAWNNIPAWNNVGQSYIQGDVVAIIQEIVNRPGWCGGRAVSLIISKMGGPGKRTALSYESDPTLAPTLSVNWDPSSIPVGGGCNVKKEIKRITASSDDAEESAYGGMTLSSSDLELVQENTTQKVGLRFQGVAIPRGATISSAYLEFEMDESHSTSTNLTIHAEASDNASTFTSQSHNISNRQTTAASTSWSDLPILSVNDSLTSPDISSLVQEVVNRQGWFSGNSMAFILSGSGKRVVESYNGETGAAAKLIVNHYGGEPTQAGGKTVRTRLIELSEEMQHSNRTPIVDTLYEAARYFRGEGVDYGRTRGDQGYRSENTRISHAASYTGGTVVRPNGCFEENLNDTDCRGEEITGNPIYRSPLAHSCQENHLVLLTDGAPTTNTAVSRTQNLIGSGCSGSGYQQCGHDLASYLKNQDQSNALSDNQNITTHTIGFNFSSSWMREMAEIHGGGGFYEASSANDLLGAFESILKDILQVDSSFVAPGVAVNQFNRLTHLNDVYFSLFRPKETPEWIGNLKRYELRGDPAVLV